MRKWNEPDLNHSIWLQKPKYSNVEDRKSRKSLKIEWKSEIDQKIWIENELKQRIILHQRTKLHLNEDKNLISLENKTFQNKAQLNWLYN